MVDQPTTLQSLSEMDFKGQELSERLFYWIIICFGVSLRVPRHFSDLVKPSSVPTTCPWGIDGPCDFQVSPPPHLTPLTMSVIANINLAPHAHTVPLSLFLQAVGWVIGFFTQDFLHTFYCWLAGLSVSVLLCVPDWPIYNRHPVKWLDRIPDRAPRK